MEAMRVGQENAGGEVAFCIVAANWRSAYQRGGAAGSGGARFAFCATDVGRKREAAWLKLPRRVKGTRPEGTQTEAEASRKVREMFTQIAPSYDLLNHVLSLQMDRLWRARVARILSPILQRADAVVLDLCCGTGDLALSLARAGPAG